MYPLSMVLIDLAPLGLTELAALSGRSCLPLCGRTGPAKPELAACCELFFAVHGPLLVRYNGIDHLISKTNFSLRGKTPRS